MIITNKALPRRTFLRGAGVALALPLLDAMIPVFSKASGAASPVRRLGFVYIPMGCNWFQWFPKQVGNLTELSPTLTPGTVKAIWLTVALAARLVPVPTCRKRILGIVIWKSRRAVAVIGVPTPGLVKLDSAFAACGSASAAATAEVRTRLRRTRLLLLIDLVFMFVGSLGC